MAFENGIRRLFVLLAVVLVCLQRYFKFVVDDPAFSERTINYAIFFIMLLTFNYQKANSKLILLFILLPIGFFIRRYLPIWILLTIIYQIINLRIPVKTLAYVAFITISCELCIQYYLVTNNIITDVVKQTIKASGRMHTWGMGNGNNLSAFFMQVFMLLYLIMKKRWFVYILLTIVCGYGIYMYTCSRTPYFTIIILCILVLCYHLGLFFKFTKYIIGALPVILFGITVYLSLFDATSNTAELDTVSSGRLTIAAYFFSHMTPLAILIGMDRPENMALDSAYIDMFMQGGLFISHYFLLFIGQRSYAILRALNNTCLF